LVNIKINKIIIYTKKNQTKWKTNWRSCRREAAMYYPRMDLAYSVYTIISNISNDKDLMMATTDHSIASCDSNNKNRPEDD